MANWTKQEIAEKLGISSAVYQKVKLGAREIGVIAKAGIRKLEIACVPHSFDYRDRGQRTAVEKECTKQGIDIVSFHTTHLNWGSEDEALRAVAMKEADTFINTVMDMGVEVYSSHFRNTPATRASVLELLGAFHDRPIIFAVENVGATRIQDAVDMVDAIGSDQFRMLLDIGHERDESGITVFGQKGKADDALAKCGGRLCSTHLHESHVMLEQRSHDHHAPMSEGGIIAWDEVLNGLKDIGYEGNLIFEDGRGENPEEWIAYTASFPGRFVERYG